MSDLQVPAPKERWYVTLVNTIIDFAINGLGAAAAYAAVVSSVPWLGGPFIGPIVKKLIELIIGKIDERIVTGADILVIRLGNDIRKAKYDQALQPIKDKDEPTDEELEAARKAIDAIVHRAD